MGSTSYIFQQNVYSRVESEQTWHRSGDVAKNMGPTPNWKMISRQHVCSKSFLRSTEPSSRWRSQLNPVQRCQARMFQFFAFCILHMGCYWYRPNDQYSMLMMKYRQTRGLILSPAKIFILSCLIIFKKILTGSMENQLNSIYIRFDSMILLFHFFSFRFRILFHGSIRF